MPTRYETFNEMTFEAYCKKAIENAVKKERGRKTARGKLELPLSVLTDAALYALSPEDEEPNRVETDCRVFYVRDIKIPVYSEKLGQALSYLLPRTGRSYCFIFSRRQRPMRSPAG